MISGFLLYKLMGTIRETKNLLDWTDFLLMPFPPKGNSNI